MVELGFINLFAAITSTVQVVTMDNKKIPTCQKGPEHPEFCRSTKRRPLTVCLLCFVCLLTNYGSPQNKALTERTAIWSPFGQNLLDGMRSWKHGLAAEYCSKWRKQCRIPGEWLNLVQGFYQRLQKNIRFLEWPSPLRGLPLWLSFLID